MSTPLYDVSTREGFLRRAVEMTDRRIPPRFRAAIASDPCAVAWCETFDAAAGNGNGPAGPAAAARARNPEPPGSLLILGATGTGKTYQAYGCIRALAARGVTVAWHADTAPGLLAGLRPREGADSEGEYRKIAAVPLLLLDDIGTAKASEWTEEILYRLINDRYEAMLPGLFTSNIPAAELRATLGDRIASRLAEMCQRVVLRGPDRRRTDG